MLNQVAKQNASGVGAAVTTQIAPDGNAVNWSIKINKDSATSGTIALTAISANATTAETVYDSYGAAVVFDAATSTAQTYYFTGKPVDLVILTPSALNGTYKYSFSQW